MQGLTDQAPVVQMMDSTIHWINHCVLDNSIAICSIYPMEESSGGIVVRALASHQCGPRSVPRLGIICGLSLLVLYSALRGFSPGTLGFPSPQKPTCDWS